MDAKSPNQDTTPQNGGEAVLTALAANGVPYLFGNAGTDFPSIIEGLTRLGTASGTVPEPITVPHENLGVAMAHGAYLATGKAQAVMLHVNVGTANALCGLLNAARENIPVLLMAGRTPITETERFGARSVFIHWGQEMFDQAGMLREIVKWEYELRTPEQAGVAIDRAVNIATSAPKGPIYLTLPREVLAASGGDQAAPAVPRAAAAPAAPDPDAIAEAAAWLAGAEKPLIVTAGAGRELDDVPALAALAEANAIPVSGYRPRHIFLPSDHPNHVGFEPAPYLPEADVIVVLDCDVPWVPKLHKINPAAKIIHAGPDPLFGQYPMRSFRADLVIQSANTRFAEALTAALAGAKPSAAREAWLAQCKAGFQERTEALRAATEGMTGIANNAWVALCLSKVMRPDDLFLIETAVPMPLIPRPNPGTYFGTTPAGGLGWGLGCALGLKLGYRHKGEDRRVISVIGDGAYMFGNPTPAHLVSAAYDLPTLTIITNNKMWAAVRRATLSLYPDGAANHANQAPLTYLEPSPDYAKVCEASGGYGETVENAEDLPAALDRALAEVEKGRQALLNVVVGYSDDDAIKDAKR